MYESDPKKMRPQRTIATHKHALPRYSDVRTTLQLYAHSVSEDRLIAQDDLLRQFWGLEGLRAY